MGKEIQTYSLEESSREPGQAGLESKSSILMEAAWPGSATVGWLLFFSNSFSLTGLEISTQFSVRENMLSIGLVGLSF